MDNRKILNNVKKISRLTIVFCTMAAITLISIAILFGEFVSENTGHTVSILKAEDHMWLYAVLLSVFLGFTVAGTVVQIKQNKRYEKATQKEREQFKKIRIEANTEYETSDCARCGAVIKRPKGKSITCEYCGSLL